MGLAELETKISTARQPKKRANFRNWTLILILGTGLASPALAQVERSSVPDQIRRLSGLDKTLMDRQADPCTDFFQYACGNFAKLHPIPSDQSSFGILTMLEESNQQILHSLLEKAAKVSSRRKANEQKIGDYYSCCCEAGSLAISKAWPMVIWSFRNASATGGIRSASRMRP